MYFVKIYFLTKKNIVLIFLFIEHTHFINKKKIIPRCKKPDAMARFSVYHQRFNFT